MRIISFIEDRKVIKAILSKGVKSALDSFGWLT
jgi:hypothetical protein